MIKGPLDQIKKAHLEALIANEVRESRTVEYKQTLPGGNDDERREFLADVSSFANTAGGDIVYGVSATDGVPKSIPGLPKFVEDTERLRLESMIRDGLDPTISGLLMHSVVGFEKGPALVVRVPCSWAAPHMVTFKNLSRFFGRNSAGRFQLDVHELRAAFTASADLAERIRRWHMERLSAIISGQTPVPLVDRPCMVLHVVPFSSFLLPSVVSPIRLYNYATSFRPVGATTPAIGGRINIDGLIISAGTSRGDNPRPEWAYCQVFRSGRIENVTTWIWREADRDGGADYLTSIWYEREAVRAIADELHALRDLGVSPPFAVLAALVGARGARVHHQGAFWPEGIDPVDRDLLQLADVQFDDFDADYPGTLRPLFDSVWHACGVPGSPNYDKDGNFKTESTRGE